MQPFELFQPGTHTDSAGRTLTFPPSAVRETADAYDPALHEAPIVVGHPAEDAPAYGWVEGLSFDGGRLKAHVRDVEPQFDELVRAGRYRKVSAAFYHPDSATNPKPGVWYLRHVGFLGAQPPAIKGLKPIEFRDGDGDVVTVTAAFGEADGWALTRLLRGLRDLIAARFSVDEAEQALPNDIIDMVDVTPPVLAPPPGYQEKKMPDNSKAAAEQAAREAACAAREERLAGEEAEMAARRAALARDELRAQAAAFLEPLVAEGRVLPADAAGLTMLLSWTDDTETAQFGEGEPATTRAFIEGFLTRLPRQVEFRELAQAEDGGAAGLDRTDADAIAEAALAYQETQRGRGVHVHIADAVRHVTEAK